MAGSYAKEGTSSQLKAPSGTWGFTAEFVGWATLDGARVFHLPTRGRSQLVHGLIFKRSADWKSAIQQVGNLRY
jgi:hypothetical protein